MDSQALMQQGLIAMLNRALKIQGLYDLRVVGLSADFQVASVQHLRDGKIIARGAVQAAMILPLDNKEAA